MDISLEEQHATQSSFIANDNDVSIPTIISKKTQILNSSPKLFNNYTSLPSDIAPKSSSMGFPREEKNETFVLPKLEKIEHSVVIINCKTDGLGLDKLLQEKNSLMQKVQTKHSIKNFGNAASSCEDDGHKEFDTPDSPVPNDIRPENHNLNKNINAANFETFEVAQTISIAFEASIWQNLYSRRIRTENNVILPSDWTHVFSSALVGSLPYCCIHFKRHKLYKSGKPKGNTNTKIIFKGWYYCTIEGCELNGTVTLDSSYSLILYNSRTILRHTKGMKNGFKSSD